MFSWGGCIIKLLISIAVASVTGTKQSIGASILMGVLVYSMISAWWYCCRMMGNYLIGTVAFLIAFFFCVWGVSSAPNIVIKIIAYIVMFAIILGGVIADIWGIIQAIRNR